MTYLTISQAAAELGISTDTLRYYEREGLIKVPRAASGHRRYAPDELGWMRMLTLLKETGMPIRVMRDFAALVNQGASSIPQRQTLLEAHRLTVTAQLARWTTHLTYLDKKIEHYAHLQECKETEVGWNHLGAPAF